MEVKLNTPFQGQSVFKGTQEELTSEKVTLRDNAGRMIVIPRTRIKSITFISTTPRVEKLTPAPEPKVTPPALTKNTATSDPEEAPAVDWDFINSHPLAAINWNSTAVRKIYAHSKERVIRRFHREHFRKDDIYIKLGSWKQDAIKKTISEAIDQDYNDLAAEQYDKVEFMFYPPPFGKGKRTYPQYILYMVMEEMLYEFEHRKPPKTYNLRLSRHNFTLYLREKFPQYLPYVAPPRGEFSKPL